MPTNKNAQLRYQILDRCFSDFHHKYTIDDLIEKVNEALYDLCGTQISIRQIREDIKYMRDRVTYNAPIETYPFDGRKSYYRYSDPTFSIFNNELSTEEVASLRSAIDILSRFRGVPSNAWPENVISSLEYRFGIMPNTENIVSFDQNELLKGTEFLGELIDSAMNHQPLKMLYRTFSGKEEYHIIHPYHLKEYNNRWFLFGLETTEQGSRIANRALDRIVKFSRVNVPFIPNKDIDFNEYFKDVIGVTIPDDSIIIEDVLLKFDKERYPYIVSKPMHPSQVIIDKDERLIQIRVKPNKELESLLFSYGPQVEVVKPLWLRQRMIQKIKEFSKIYSIDAERLHNKQITL